MAASEGKPRWFYPTQDRLVIVLLVSECLLWLSSWLGWPQWHKGYAVLTTIAVVGVAMLLMLLWFFVALILRRRFQFSLRTLLALVVVVALPFSWLGVEMKRTRSESRVAEAMNGLGFDVFYYDDEVEPDDKHMVFFMGSLYCYATGRECGQLVAEPSEPLWLRDWLGKDFFRSPLAIEVQGDQAKTITVDDLRRVLALQSLKRLGLDDAENLTDADFAVLNRNPCLERLFLKGTRISNRGLRELSGLTNLRYLSLARTKITDEGLAYLKSMPRLEMLELSDTDISDEGLKHLRGLARLQWVYVDGTKVTKKGVEELQAALPHCIVLLCGPGVIGYLDRGHEEMGRGLPLPVLSYGRDWTQHTAAELALQPTEDFIYEGLHLANHVKLVSQKSLGLVFGGIETTALRVNRWRFCDESHEKTYSDIVLIVNKDGNEGSVEVPNRFQDGECSLSFNKTASPSSEGENPRCGHRSCQAERHLQGAVEGNDESRACQGDAVAGKGADRCRDCDHGRLFSFMGLQHPVEFSYTMRLRPAKPSV